MATEDRNDSLTTSGLIKGSDIIRYRVETLGIFGHDIQRELIFVKSHPKEQTEHESPHEFLKVKLFLLLCKIGQQAHQDIKPMMQRLGDVVLKILLAKRLDGRFTLKLPLFPVDDKDARSVEFSEDVAGESTTDVVLTVVLLDVLKICWMVYDVHSKEWNGQFIGRAVAFVKRVPSLTTSSAIGLELFYVALQWSTLWAADPFGIGRGGCPDASAAVRPAHSFWIT